MFLLISNTVFENLEFDQEAAGEDPQYSYVDNEGDYESALALANGANNLYTFQLHRNSDQLQHPNLHHHRGSSLGSSITHLHDLRLAWSWSERWLIATKFYIKVTYKFFYIYSSET